MKRTSLRRLAAGASAAALVSAGALFGSSAAFAQPTPEETQAATEPAAQPADSGQKSEEEKHDDSAEKQAETETEEQQKPASAKTKELSKTDEPAEDDGDDDAPAFDPQVSSAPDEITAADLTDPDKGISITASNLQAGDVVTDNLTNKPNTADGDKLTTSVYYTGDASDLKVGDTVNFTVTVAREGEESKTFDFTVTIIGEDDGDDEAPAFDPQVSSAPDEITAADLADPDKGISITASNLQPGDVVTDNLTNKPNTADGDKLTASVYYEGDPSDFEVGQKVGFTVTVSREGEESKTFDFTVTIIGEDDGDDETMEPELKISPQKISVTDFRNENKGVQLTVTNCYPGEAAAFIIEHENGELSYEVDADTNDDGTAVIEHIHGTGNAPDSAYTGTYTVTVICGDGESDGTFSVHADDNGKGGGDSDKGRDRDRNELPRTGSDLTALYGAASLLAVGAAAMVVSRRKSTKQ
ncbi:LPXTG cell wall anchor domain-containing protein [Brevibacterium luteolum]|uniref:Gram-positive cocci surface proteins LPxTG domain-containing protein n=1 Tax=Brevibacterium luteolum TaxID=199591 RepID=A0A849AS41_9MICO|nr:LPXTG cell wall anchor domain-containing protein [Brevibacterium luteolum]MBM7529474.1 LPXTG-motif cell wall-anchored protein [Brevibacterium luteolum]NNG79483.1 hypothetical protein [Brevibacterium luteolum]